MKTFFQKVFAIVLTLTILVSALPVGAISIFAAEVSDVQVGDTIITKTDAAPEDVDGGIWVLKESTTLYPNPSYTCVSVEHTHTDSCFTKSCDHKDGHQPACYSNSTAYELCTHSDDSEHSGTVDIMDVITIKYTGSNTPAGYTWKEDHPAYSVVYAEFVKLGGNAIAAAKLFTKKFCYTSVSGSEPDLCTHVCSEVGGKCYTKICLFTEHTHSDGEDGCIEYTWVLEADVNNNNIVDGTEGDPFYSVTFTDGVDGEEIFADATFNILAGADGNLLSTPVFEGNTTREHYTFAGFEGYNPEAALVAGDYTFVAQWTPNNYTITWDAGEGTFADGETTIDIEFAYGTMPSAPAIPSKEATQEYTYNFLGWTPDISAVAGNATYVAQYGATPKTEEETPDRDQSEDVEDETPDIDQSENTEEEKPNVDSPEDVEEKKMSIWEKIWNAILNFLRAIFPFLK